MLIIHYEHQKNQFLLINMVALLIHSLFWSLAEDQSQICVIGAEGLFSVKHSLPFFPPSIICASITEDESCSLKIPLNSSRRYPRQITFGVYIVLRVRGPTRGSEHLRPLMQL